ncbi:MAG: PilZ domain-containing protein [Desulfohalobiaceae bacterium]|nr:PilZ domain-containing protein [Desulfohalobiaceae bacterium]
MNQSGKTRRLPARGLPRQSVHPPLDLPLVSQATRRLVKIHNYSPGGLYIELSDQLPPGSRVRLEWQESPPPMFSFKPFSSLPALVRWSKKLDEGSHDPFGAGLQLLLSACDKCGLRVPDDQIARLPGPFQLCQGCRQTMQNVLDDGRLRSVLGRFYLGNVL